MKKSTILIVSIVFLASVLVVGIFGTQSRSYEETINVDKITINHLSNAAEGEIDVKVNENGEYYTYINPKKFSEGITFNVDIAFDPIENTTESALVGYVQTPENLTLKDGIFVEEDGTPVAKIEGTTITFYQMKSKFKIQFKVEDANGATCVLNVYWIKAPSKK